jgi:hypothetical protein
MHIGYWWERQKRLPGSPRRRWVDNIEMDLTEFMWTGSNWLRIGTSGGL